MPAYNIDPKLAESLNYTADPELDLLDDEPMVGDSRLGGSVFETSPIFTGDALQQAGLAVFPQRALYGRIIEQHVPGFPVIPVSPKLYMNTNAPFSGLLCGVQGSGKSHSTAVLMESCLIRDERLGTLPTPLSALLFHYDTAAGGHFQPCEAAYIGSLNERHGGDPIPPKVTVLVLPETLQVMRRAYARLPTVTVEPLHFAPEDISGDRLLAMMKVDQGQHMPLYMESIMTILRTMAGGPFNYKDFRNKVDEQSFSQNQKAMLNLRLELLESCIRGGNISNRVSRYFTQGQLTIIDLSSPFMDGSSACGFFDMILGLFIEAETGANGKLVVLDEAHKYLTNSGSSARLTDTLLSVIRQQRHLAMRVLISTQEPTVVPTNFIGLCSFVIVHRFSSPAWFEHLKQHIPVNDQECFSKVATLRIGEAMIIAPAGVGLRHFSITKGLFHKASDEQTMAPFGQGYLFVRSRKRITQDGGRSLLAVPDPSTLPVDHWPASITPSLVHSSPSIPGSQAELPLPKAEQLYEWWDQYTSVSGSDSRAFSKNIFHSSPLEGKEASDRLPPTPIPARAASPRLLAGSSYPSRELIDPPSDTAPSIASIDVSQGPSATEMEMAQCLELVAPRFRTLVALLQKSREGGQPRMSWAQLGTELKQQNPPPYQGKLGSYLSDAVQDHLIEIGSTPYEQWVQLAPRKSVLRRYTPLVAVLRTLSDEGQARPLYSVVASSLHKQYPNSFSGKFKQYAQEAEAAGIITCDTKEDRVCLVLRVL